MLKSLLTSKLQLLIYDIKSIVLTITYFTDNQISFITTTGITKMQ